MKVRRISTVPAGPAWAGAAWGPEGRDVVRANGPYGAIVHAVACDQGGSPRYDLPLWADPPNGAIVVPVLPDGRLMLVEQWRPAALRPGDGAVYPPGDLSNLGALSLELPRGFPGPTETPEEAALREAEEETGLRASSARAIGWCNPNTTFWMHPIRIVEVRLDDVAVPAHEEADERIVRRLAMSAPEVRDAVRTGRIFCGLTQAALASWWACGPVGSATP